MKWFKKRLLKSCLGIHCESWNKKLYLLCNCLNHTSFTLISNFNQPRITEHFQIKSCIFLNQKSSIQPFYFLNTCDLVELIGIILIKNINFSKMKNSTNMNKMSCLRFLVFYTFNVIFILCPLISKLTYFLVLCLSISWLESSILVLSVLRYLNIKVAKKSSLGPLSEKLKFTQELRRAIGWPPESHV